jgi:RNA polymerase sigma-70 factor, ECF subfamily
VAQPRTVPNKQQNLPIPDEDLVRRTRAGDAAAFDHLFTRYKDGVYACLWHLLSGDAELVEEAVGNVFLSAYRNLGKFRGDSLFTTWLYRIAVNEAHARIRQKRRWQLLHWFSLHELDDVAAAPKAADPSEYLMQVEGAALLFAAVRALPEPYRTPVILRYISGMASPEIATVLRRPAGTVRYQLSRALQILRERLGSDWTH